MSKKDYIIGIDLGSVNSCVTVMEGGESVVIPNAEGNRTTASVVGFTKDDDRKIGNAAKRQAVTNPEKTVHLIKRLIGKSYEQVKDMKFPFKVVNEGGRPAVVIDDRKYSPEEISAMVIQSMKKTAEDYLGAEVKKCVITVPAHFGDQERAATKVAGEIAGMEVMRVINEPTAAALAYFQNKKDADMKIAVYDFGGSTFDISVLDYSDGVYEVISSDGDLYLGGYDIDQRIVDYLVEEFKKAEGADLSKDPMAMQRVIEAAEKAKIELSSSPSTDINLPYITSIDNMPKHLVMGLSRAKFDELSHDIVAKTLENCKTALSKGKLSISDIDEVILVGGSTRIPAVQEGVKKFFGKEPNKGVNPDEVVALGAAIQGGVISGDVQDVLLLDVISISYAIETMGGVATKMVEANTTIPCRKSETFSTAVDNQQAVTIRVSQGERSMFTDNRLVGSFDLGGIDPQPRGIPQIEVTFDIDANGILKVSAKDKATGKENSIKIEGSSALSKEEIEKMKADAEANAEADKKKLEEVNILNGADSMIFQVEKTINEEAAYISAETKTAVEEVLGKLREAKDKRDVDAVKSITEEAQTKLQGLYTEISEARNKATNESATEPQAEASTETVEDVAYEEVAEEEKN